ncbi:CO or xanthine dehydrogenase, FAD-binding subunit [Burkholderia sp. YR290]|jgi:xanthine dehydrogenase YagS FAD-binding subunit|uniref:FAD binding domain-containing protein n=1 Tax=Paraburkholderia hospita TaxID=169430 RepID=UPI000271589C|nr:xanthine dehydrogenase family protein subunit M [Paraburkholderia hospita]EUC20989.1 Xanthine dehydrogenase [Burkholderia sp. BT03]SKC57064.1 CO or xanthine dehydrogenase, FAD-binding subunit [Paraburkholderia hospita]SKD06131.1 CO or xanthine dehydrogenase, FAD-binding subunit [Paraburkholderia hospita]SOE87535.1 CO or xanthine dehydrogenase, FAD-binding subunit [Burkholderia sp. YR290]
MRTFEFVRATSVGDAVTAHSQGAGTVFLAGGTTLLDLMKLDVMRPARLVDIHKLGLDGIEVLDDGRVRVGAMVTNTELARHEHIRRAYPVLSQALLSGASTQLRNKATTAGNLMQRVRCGYFRDGVSACNKREPGSGCAATGGQNRNVHAVLGGSDQCIAAHPSDMCVAMAAIGAKVHAQGPTGARDIDFLDLHRLPGNTPWKEHALNDSEMITHVTLDAPLAHGRSAYLKLRDRGSYQFALASSAAILVLDGATIREARLALGGVATKPWRALNAEAALKGQSASAQTFRRAAAIAFEDARSYGQNGFKIALGQQAVVRNLSSLVA